MNVADLNRTNTPNLKVEPTRSNQGSSAPALLNLPKFHLNQATVADARIAALKVLALTLLAEIESLETRINSSESPLNLQDEVHRFEAALIRVALTKTGGRQRRAARLLGTKVTTLNTKIKRYGIVFGE
jgi:transcriptional regulator with GAF, ATPase, and Fis domain